MKVRWIGPHLVCLGQARFTGEDYEFEDAVATELAGRGLVRKGVVVPTGPDEDKSKGTADARKE